MSVFIDTSALYAIMDRDDANHVAGRSQWERLLTSGTQIVTSNYVLVETYALVQHRLGMDAVHTLHDDVLAVLNVHWIGERQHAAALAAVLAGGRRKLSLVDCSSFVLMRENAIYTAFAFDVHFKEQGFDLCR